ncbi:ferrous iron transport protein B [Clostridium fallax]|uniref:Ferrous iron transport protein B n=1 Tax=Clostridium fallax TaxID=1533 RepID=A0A1M4SMN6_9CLOT|nr:ferrous iron transport protein B [Clostridium fallax]SHE33534.1 ferrous iron transport protein B [Clostridium fallax]SQB07898.1 ferrous iron transport protein B [Clostridium fallax]
MNTIALAGNPNCGKTSIFNILTKSRQHVGNWPGVTVEKKEGKLKYNGEEFTIVDLPGTYSLGAYSEDEIVARNYIIQDKPDVVINVVDATNIERNLYLTTQLIEMGANVVVALNMMDSAKDKGIDIDVKKLSKELGVPIIPTVALKREGIDELIKAAISTKNASKGTLVDYGEELKEEIKNLESVLSAYKDKLNYMIKWTALKLLENDNYMKNLVTEVGAVDVLNQLEKSNNTISDKIGFEAEMAIVDKRYTYISSITSSAIRRQNTRKETLTDKIDKVVTNKFLGIPIFAVIMFLLYQITFTIGAGMQDWLDGAIGDFGGIISDKLASSGAPEFLSGFVSDGLIAGLGSVISFLPLIMVMYFLIGLLEDSGYMARSAYVMDRLMRSLGLHGKTFVSMIVGSGCNVPGIMSTRTLENKKDRMIAILINPFVSCGARLPVYMVFVAAFFPNKAGIILFSLYALGIIIALISGKIFSKTLFKGETSYFVMELPPYRIPSIKNVLMLTWEKAGAFLKKAGVVILPLVVVIWVLSVLPAGVEQYSDESILGKVGNFLAPIFAPAGFGNWQAAVSLFAGIIAKESVVATMGMVYAGVDEGDALISAIQGVFTPLTALSFMVMSLLYTPCVAALGAVKRETNSWKWTIFTAVYTFIVALIIATIVYQVGFALGYR